MQLPRLSALLLSCAALASPAAQALDLFEVWRAASQHDPEFAAARAAHAAGLASQDQAGALWRPNLMLQGGVAAASLDNQTRGATFDAGGFSATGAAFDTTIDSGTRSHYGVVLRQPLFDRERSAQGRQLRIQAGAAELAWVGAQQQLMLRSAEHYFQLALAARRLELLERQLEAVERTASEAAERFKVGSLPVTDLHEARARAAGLRAQHLAAQTELDLRRQTLADLIGREPGDSPLTLPSDSPAQIGALEEWLTRAARQNTQLQLAQTRQQGAEQEVRKTSLPLSPTLELVASHGREKLSGDAEVGSASYSAEQSMVGLQVAIPLYTGGMRSARQDEARARLAEAEAELDHGRLLVARQTRAAWLALSVGREQAQALAAAAEASQARLAATRIGRKTGERSTQDLLDAENAAATAELELAQVRATLFLQELRLAALAGQLDEGFFQQASARLAQR
ncbi:MAG TPA: TolC family outer membrane protein [Pseudomonas sp.]|uniref:TolC family outer membrane protein n=1 Tax=Pseudomonas sp. TaxID=306 RepID=UPI002BB53082|nr:TolC family outer membrane protein [Pseudomonas sp.]HTO18627.1 TolC family outer membrane protein [Pseudomonas sp.]